MSKIVDYKAIKKQERAVGKTVSKMVESSITKQLRAFGLVDSAVLEESVVSKPIMGQLRLFRINTTMAKHGFIQQYGIKEGRTGHIRVNQSKLFYTVKEHTMRMQNKPFITQGIENSGAFEYLMDGIGKIRMQEVPIAFNGSNISVK